MALAIPTFGATAVTNLTTLIDDVAQFALDFITANLNIMALIIAGSLAFSLIFGLWNGIWKIRRG